MRLDRDAVCLVHGHLSSLYICRINPAAIQGRNALRQPGCAEFMQIIRLPVAWSNGRGA
jgi:hypothetical protein